MTAQLARQFFDHLATCMGRQTPDLQPAAVGRRTRCKTDDILRTELDEVAVFDAMALYLD